MPVVLATGGFDHKIRLWDATTGTSPRFYRFNDSQINCLSTSTDKAYLVAGGNPLINLYDLKSQSDSPLLTYDGHTSNVMTVGFEKDGKWIYSCSEDGTLRIWDVRAPTCQVNFDCGTAINSTALHPNQMELITGDHSGSVKVWDLQMNACREQVTPQVESPVRSISVAYDGSILTVGCHKGHVYVYNLAEGKLQQHHDFQGK
jgi:target of rapamycin complex subunit LST8